MIKAIVFDCFGVLVGRGFLETYRLAGGDPLQDRDFIYKSLDKTNLGLISERNFHSIMAKKLNLTEMAFAKILEEAEQPNTELLALIRHKLKPVYKIGLLSNANRGVVESKIAPGDLELFDVRVISAEVGYMKPEPEIFTIARDRLGVEFGEMVFIDDLQPFVEGAAKLGINAVLYTGIEDLKRQFEALKLEVL